MGKISFKTICVSASISFLIFHILITVISSDIQGVEGSKESEEMTVEDVSREEKMQEMFDRENRDDMNEVSLEDGRKFKLFEKKRLQHNKAQSFCKKREGQLVRAMNLDEMRRLQMLLMRARMIGDQIWIGADKKLWKKYSKKVTGPEHPNLGPEVMAFGGGGPTDMCPALSTSTRSLTPAPCHHQLPFICEFDPGKGKKLKKTGGSKNKTKTSKKRETKFRDEMRRKREIMSGTFSPDDIEDEAEESSNSTSTTTSVLDFDTKNDYTPTPSLTTSQTDENFIAGHHIGFLPRIVAFSKNTTAFPLNSEVLSSTNNGMIERINYHPGHKKRLAKNDIHLKFSTKLLLQTDATIDDPDQQMLDLINEQSENLMADINTTEVSTTSSTGHPAKLVSVLDDNSLVTITTPKFEAQSQATSELIGQPDASFSSSGPTIQSEDVSSSTQGTQEFISEMGTTLPDLGRGTRSFSVPFSPTMSTTVTLEKAESGQFTSEMNRDSTTTTYPPSILTSSFAPTLAQFTTFTTNNLDQGTSTMNSVSSDPTTTTVHLNELLTTMTPKSSETTTSSMMQMTTTGESRIRPELTTTTEEGQVATPRMTTPSSGNEMLTTGVTGAISTTENASTQMNTPPAKSTSESMTATAPKTTIDPMTQPMQTMQPGKSETATITKLGAHRGSKSFSVPGKLTPTANTTAKVATESPLKHTHNMSLHSLLNPRGTLTPPIKSPTSTSTNSPAALLTLRVKSTSQSRGTKRDKVSVSSTTDTSGDPNVMKSSIPTLLIPQNASKEPNALPIPYKLAATG